MPTKSKNNSASGESTTTTSKRKAKVREEDEEPKKAKYVIPDTDYWKLYKAETLIILKLCYPCLQANQKRDEKYHKQPDGKITLEYQMCQNCFEGNVVRSNDHYKYFPYIKPE
ncbi:hypothetical protein DdX_22474 [Ditylenchus destructor]|uniref:Uncharacterized protein n=1 Tax=Ditylenchus destructor TaxID=166010 RepID=A0AAD4MHG2_9BILA|nr:hypothetical protein DdX_22474 [Ditylenchus destructor]